MQVAEHVIEGAILEHQDDDVVDLGQVLRGEIQGHDSSVDACELSKSHGRDHFGPPRPPELTLHLPATSKTDSNRLASSRPISLVHVCHGSYISGCAADRRTGNDSLREARWRDMRSGTSLGEARSRS